MSLAINKSVTKYFMEKEIKEKVWRDDLNDGRCVDNFSDYTYEYRKIAVEISKSEYYKYKKEGKEVFTKKEILSINVESSIKSLLKELKSLENDNKINSNKRKIRIAKELIDFYQLQIDDVRNELNSVDKSMYSDKFFESKDEAIKTLESKIEEMVEFSRNTEKELATTLNSKAIKKLQLEKKKLLKEKMDTIKRIDDRIKVIENELNELTNDLSVTE